KNSEPSRESKTPATATAAVGVLRITSNPAGASVLQNGRHVGKTTYENKSAEPGFYDIIVRLDGYQDYTQRISVTAGQTATVDASLTRKEIAVSEKPGPKDEDRPALTATGTAKILVRPFGSIFIDGKPRLQDSDRQHSEELSTGKHTIRALHPKFGVWEKEITISAGKTVDLRIDFTKEVRATLASKPVWGDIYVDNQPTGFQTTKEIKLRIGQRIIEVRREGYETVGGKRILNFDEDLSAPLVFELRKK
ncbi:MAG TPA: PEGA domain-containing protein, partial [bacterium]